MTDPMSEIRARLRAADRALALARGGSSELAQVREAVGSLLVAVHALAGLWASRDASPTDGQAGQPARRRRQP